ncbi:arylsulfatase D-like isoform X1 [Lissotriton helveticus]
MGYLKHNRSLVIFLVCSLLIIARQSNAATPSKPNILLIMADDLGIGDIGCYGNDTIRTPNIDGLAKEGVKLTHHISAAPLCTPSRAAFMTGRYPSRSGMDYSSWHRVLMWLAASGGIPPNETTFAEIMQQQGYSTGLIGKWHLGLSCESRNDHCHHPLKNGFDYFYGMPFTLFEDCDAMGGTILNPHLQSRLMLCSQLVALAVFTLLIGKLTGLLSISWKVYTCFTFCGLLFFISWYSWYGFARYWNCIIMRNHEIIEQPMRLERSASLMVKEAQAYIARNQQRPFLLMFSLLHVHSPLIVTKMCSGKSKHGPYGDYVEEMDDMVGKILNSLDEKGLKNNTLVYFASDHGAHLEDRKGNVQVGGWNGIYKGGKAMAGWEGGIRVPGILRWPGVLPAGTEIDEPTSLMDIFPTVIHLGGGELPDDRIIDGKNLMPLLQGHVPHSEHEFLFHFCGIHLHAVRWHQKDSGAIWKAHYITPIFHPEGGVGCFDLMFCQCDGPFVAHHYPPLLYDLSKDPSEDRPISEDTEPRFLELIKRIDQAVADHQKTITPVPQQLSLYNAMWKPWLQPCCGIFPFCWCDAEGDHDQTIA